MNEDVNLSAKTYNDIHKSNILLITFTNILLITINGTLFSTADSSSQQYFVGFANL